MSGLGTSGGGQAGLVLGALGDPTRRTIVELLGSRGEATATELAAELAISRQAVAKHLGLLADTGLAVSRRTGRENRFALDVEPLSSVTEWVAGVESLWAHRLDRLRQSLTESG